MTKNVGGADKIIRYVAGVVLIAMFFLKITTGTIGVIALVVGIYLLVTGFIGWCPINKIFGLDTRHIEKF